jgi:hypothetical protein
MRRSRAERKAGRSAEVVSLSVARLREIIETIPEDSGLWRAQFGSRGKAEMLVRIARLELNNRTVVAAVREPDGMLRVSL